MITRDNLNEVIKQLSNKDKKRIKKSEKEYIVLELHIFNAGSFTTCKLTNDFNKYANVSNYGNCILELSEVVEIINEIELKSDEISKRIQTTITSCINCEDEDLNGQNEIIFIYNDFLRVTNYPYNLQRMPKQKDRFIDYLKGMPSMFDVTEYYQDLAQIISVNWGLPGKALDIDGMYNDTFYYDSIYIEFMNMYNEAIKTQN